MTTIRESGMQSRHRVTIRRSGLTDGLRGHVGTATFCGHATNNGESIYTVVLDATGRDPGHAFRASDLTFHKTANAA